MEYCGLEIVQFLFVQFMLIVEQLLTEVTRLWLHCATALKVVVQHLLLKKKYIR